MYRYIRKSTTGRCHVTITNERTNERTYLRPIRRSALVDDAALDIGDPVRQQAIEQGIHGDGARGQVLGLLEAQLAVPQEGGRRYGEGPVPQRQPRVRQLVVLAELQAVQVVRDRVIGGVL